MNSAVAVFGLSGVGKSTERVVLEAGGLARSVNAGELSRRRRRDADHADSLRVLAAEEIQHNQELLVSEFAAERAKGGSPVLLLDGHCVVDIGERLVTVSVDVIEQLDLAALVFVHARLSVIAERRMKDSHRARPRRGEVKLSRQQEAGLVACTSYAVGLGLPLAVVTAEQYAVVVSLVDLLARVPIGR